MAFPYRPQYPYQISHTNRVAVPAVAADVVAKDSIIYQITVCNTTAGAITVTIKDKDATASEILKDTSIAANTTYVIAFPFGEPMVGGINWVASGVGLKASIYGYYRA